MTDVSCLCCNLLPPTTHPPPRQLTPTIYYHWESGETTRQNGWISQVGKSAVSCWQITWTQFITFHSSVYTEDETHRIPSCVTAKTSPSLSLAVSKGAPDEDDKRKTGHADRQTLMRSSLRQSLRYHIIRQ